MERRRRRRRHPMHVYLFNGFIHARPHAFVHSISIGAHPKRRCNGYLCSANLTFQISPFSFGRHSAYYTKGYTVSMTAPGDKICQRYSAGGGDRAALRN
jgi:hypothetical protein